jgi:hypothetical protein
MSGTPLDSIVRYDLADRLRGIGLYCAARCVALAATPRDWRDITTDAHRALVAHHRTSEAAAKAATIRAATRLMEAGDVAGAAALLAATPLGLPVGAWAERIAQELPMAVA